MNSKLYGGLIELSPDGQPLEPEIVLAHRNGDKYGVIQCVHNINISDSLSAPAEVSFDVEREADGNRCVVWRDIVDFKTIFIPRLASQKFNPWFELYVDIDDDDATIKHCRAVHLQEAELGQLSLNNIEINTESDIKRSDYVPAKLFNPDKPEASILHRILKDKAPHYTIHHVDAHIADMQRSFSWNGVSIKDAFDDLSNELECIFSYGESSDDDQHIHRTISVYALSDYCPACGERGVFLDGICPKCQSTDIRFGYGSESGVFLSKENFANTIRYSTNVDSVKNCFRLTAGDDLMTATIRNINPSGSQYIWRFNDNTKADMSDNLRHRLDLYDSTVSDIYSTVNMTLDNEVARYNQIANKYAPFGWESVYRPNSPILGYQKMTELYYNAMNLYIYLKTSMAPLSMKGKKTTATAEVDKISDGKLSVIGIHNAKTASGTTVALAVAACAKVYIDTSLYRVTAETTSYSFPNWSGKVKISSFSDDNDTATSNTLSLSISDGNADIIKTQIDKAMKKSDVDATNTVSLFSNPQTMSSYLKFYSEDNLRILENIARGCLDILIKQGVGSPKHQLHTSMYKKYIGIQKMIQSEINDRIADIRWLKYDKNYPLGIIDEIERRRRSIISQLDIKSFLGEEMWAELCSFRRDDDIKNDNYISVGLSDSEIVNKATDFMKWANREVVKSSTLQHKLSCNVTNPMLVKSDMMIDLHGGYDDMAVLSPILDRFEVGNWIRLEVDEKIYRLRMVEFDFSYDKPEDIKIEFSDVVYAGNYMTDVKSVLSKAKSMSTSFAELKRKSNNGADAYSHITAMVENGLDMTKTRIVDGADKQDYVLDDTGFLMREKNEFGEEYSGEQVKIINHGFYYTTDGWDTVETGLGHFSYFDPESRTYKDGYGIIANTIVGNIILGNEVGIYNSSGGLKIDDDGFVLTSNHSGTGHNVMTIQKEVGRNDGVPVYEKQLYIDDDGNLVINAEHLSIGSSRVLTENDGVDISGSVERMIDGAIGNLAGKEDVDNIRRLIEGIDGRTPTIEELERLRALIEINLQSDEMVAIRGISRSIEMSNNGIRIGNNIGDSGSGNSKTSLVMNDEKISFMDGDIEVASISKKKLRIEEGIFTDDLSVGNHRISKFKDGSGGDNIYTFITWTGGIAASD